MKPGRGRRMFRKILEFFHFTPPVSIKKQTAKKTCYTFRVVGPKDHSTTTTNYDDCPPQYTCNSEDEKSAEESFRIEIQNEVVQLWRRVWLGLYEVDDGDGIYERRHHYDRLEALYLGAGFPGKLSTAGLDALRRWFLWISPRNGMAALRLFDNMSIPTLQSIIEVLNAYESEIPHLLQLYSILGKAQLGLTQLLALKNDHIAETKKRFLAIAKPMARRLEKYDIRVDVLTMRSFDEAMALGHEGFRQKGQHVYYKAFPNRRR
ncbi:hypothetical protein N7478_003149 [Penicillium angulare]|uniref:uncharacterized protein n=1 Tax=Penicillium angulare TaxID=116970 RepID=UPI002541D037|nr:uncharacterized protein N7478_003149 [Penicillium angulare]KAJ5287463.1 hypothetical protein N7478_003149 [Penicillium angulare]